MTPPKASKTILSLEKALRIIEIMANEGAPMRLMDIAAAASLPASTALRLLNTLQVNGYVLQEVSSQRYRLSLKLFHIGNQIASGISIIAVAKPFLVELAAQTGHSVNLAVPQGSSAVIVDIVQSPAEDVLITTQAGRILPLYCSAIGRALLMDHSRAQLESYWNAAPITRYTDLTTDSLEALAAKMEQSRAWGYTFDPGELREGIAGIGAPLRSGNGQIIGAISLAELSSLITPEMTRSIGRLIAAAAEKIAGQL